MLKEFLNQKIELKIFLIIILLRPILEGTYAVRNISPFLSPLNISALFLALIFLYSIIKEKIFLKNFLFIGLSSIIIINILFLFIFNLNLNLNLLVRPGGNLLLSFSLKLIYPVLCFLFIYYHLKTSEDFSLYLKIFLLSLIFPLLLIIYEMIAGPINPYIPGGRTVLRYRGIYADGVNYTIYWLFAVLLLGYLVLKRDEKRLSLLLIPVITIVCAGLFYLSQAAAYFTFGALFLLLIIFLFRKNYPVSLAVIGVLLIISASFYQFKIKASAESLFQHEVAVFTGEAGIEAGINGRIRIWKDGISEFGKLPLYANLFGAPLAQGPTAFRGDAGAHNDFVRILISTGFIGLALYLYLLFLFLKKVIKLQSPEKFLGLGLFIITILLSVSLTPTFYITFLNFAIPISIFLWKSENFSNQ